MPSKKRRIHLTLPDDLDALVRQDAEASFLGAGTRVMQILAQHYRAQIPRSSPPAKTQVHETIDFSGAPSRFGRFGQRSKDEAAG